MAFSNPASGYIDESLLQKDLTQQDKLLRELFITHYLDSYDPVRAAISCGFLATVAHEFAHDFMNEGYTRRRIAYREKQVNANRDKTDLNRIRSMLFEQATFNGPGCSHGARVNALGRLIFLIKEDVALDTNDVRNLKIEFA